jgi:uncharacterized protein (TIGR03067 family)
MLRAPALVGLLLAAAIPAAASEAGQLEGTWRLVEGQRDGAPAAELVGNLLELTEGRFRISAGGNLLYAGTYSLEPAAKPALIDFRHNDGWANGQVWEGIYQLEGGRLSICDDAPDVAKPRPTSFTTAPGSGHVLIIFER